MCKELHSGHYSDARECELGYVSPILFMISNQEREIITLF